ncbi:MAG: hypothetical protein DMF06_05015 [Verrucomicrobia bacterium]|nr:MAG: hypothetical protein DMF06_05015 [Verrucomicrobiota bacterium]
MSAKPFPDMPDWPDKAPPPMGHNAPPLEERLTLEFEEALRVKGLDARVAEITAAAGRAPDVTDEDAAGKVGDLLAQAKEAAKAVEAEREVLNRPLLNAQRTLKAKADGLVAPMRVAMIPLQDKLDEFMADHATVHGDMGARVGSKESWEFKVVDFGKLPKSIRTHPTVLEAIDKVIRALVKSGERKIAGVQIWPVTKANVR